MYYQQWLQSYACMSLFTNEEILNDSTLAPDGWFNPYTLTQEDIAKKRSEFTAALDWQCYCENYLPNLDAKEQRKIKLAENINRDVAMCGKRRLRVSRKTGKLEEYPAFCGRPDLCQRCKTKKEKETFDYLVKLDGCQFVEIEPESRKGWMKILGKDKVYFQPLENGKILMVTDTDDEIGGREFTFEHAKQYACILPKDTKTSGKLGKSSNAIDEPTNEPTETIWQSTYVIDASNEEMKAIYKEYEVETFSILPRTLYELQPCINACEAILESILKRHCTNIHNTKRSKSIMKESDFDWTWKEKESHAPIEPTLSG